MIPLRDAVPPKQGNSSLDRRGNNLTTRHTSHSSNSCVLSMSSIPVKMAELLWYLKESWFPEKISLKELKNATEV